MGHLKINLECSGDAMTALSEAKQLCNAGKYEALYVYFNDLKEHISVQKDSNICDLYEIYSLKKKLKAKQL